MAVLLVGGCQSDRDPDPDPAPDPGPAVAAVGVAVRCAPSTSWTFPDTAVGQTSTVVMLVTGTAAGSLPGPTIDGPDAAAFHIDSGSTCMAISSLEAGDTCTLLVEHTPLTSGAHQAAVHLGATSFPIRGAASAAAQGLVVSVRNMDTVRGLHGVGGERLALLVNQGTETIALEPAVLSGAGLDVRSTEHCPGTLAPGGTCEIELSVSQSVTGCVAGDYRLSTSAGDVEIPITSRFVGGLEISGFSGEGAGRVVSSPPGIDCTLDNSTQAAVGRCRHSFTGPATLTAIPEDGHHFNGWSGDLIEHCGREPSCVVDPDVLVAGLAPPTARVAFASPQASAIDVTFAGGGRGRVATSPITSAPCTSSCKMWVEGSGGFTIFASSPSGFGGWSGACGGDRRTCDLGAGLTERAVTATFLPDDRETSTMLPPTAFGSPSSSSSLGGIAPDGELILVRFGGRVDARPAIERQSQSGATRWSTRVDLAGVLEMKVAAAGQIYVLGPDRLPGRIALIQLSPTGEVGWTRSVPSPAGSVSFLAVSATGRAAVGVGSGDVQLFAPDGTRTGSIVVAGARVAAIDSTGMVVVATEGALSRFDASGAPLTPSWQLTACSSLALDPHALEFDGEDFLVMRTSCSLEDKEVLSRLDRTGAPVFSKVIASGDSILYGRGGSFAVSGTTVFSWLSTGQTRGIVNTMLETYDAAGERTWTINKDEQAPVVGGFNDGVRVGRVACNAHEQCAAFGLFEVSSVAQPWIEVFTVPSP